MATKSISELSASDPLVGTEVIPVVQSAATVKATIDDIAARTLGYFADQDQQAVSLTISSPVSATSPALKITQLGTDSEAHAILIQDSTDPDSTPFTIDSAGYVLVGATQNTNSGIQPKLQVHGTGTSNSSAGTFCWSSTEGNTSTHVFSRSLSGTVGTLTPVTSGTNLGALYWNAVDNSSVWGTSAILKVEAEGTVSADAVPASFSFLLNKNNETSTTEVLKITSDGNVHLPEAATTMTDGFFYIPKASGAPSGTPAAITGCAPMYYDSSANKFYIHNGTAWKSVTLT